MKNESLQGDKKSFKLLLTSMEKKLEDTASESITIQLDQKVKVMEKQIETKIDTIENV